ncbi:hypothetical protein AMATHDRAFT_135540 [Amanita thiersii Skay4041]|uniref:tRNA(Ile)-lysidine synthetase n=1 Tax=Amanita thiersii Skay4041 TaxID=703135 RepID=A0A2A9P0Q2_9AGAR|nr:hypothetical protein AMATHDRAFT_135540 [Amanita thiersii Skay4041]
MRIHPITNNEFGHLLRNCTPPGGWPKVIGVANSGGPDSTCLLFLIHRYLSDDVQIRQENLFPRRVVSFTVDHDLQPSSAAMANDCARSVRSLCGVEHKTVKIPWSTPPFPERPIPGKDAFENIARLARYQMLLRCMRSIPSEDGGPVDVIAFGHHADDQVETALMRLSRGTSELGASGMKPCRRWGMGIMNQTDGVNSLGWTGYEGMNKWIIRPLLEVSKDRILATCHANGLKYATDTSNFQPHITIRNAIRALLRSEDGTLKEPLSLNIQEQLSTINKAISSFKSISVDLSSGAEQLQGAIKVLTSRLGDVDGEVDSIIKRYRISSPTGTFLISSRGLSPVQRNLVRKSLVLRIMRYVSFHPWGSLRADGQRRKASLDQIIGKLWTPNPFTSGIRMFVAGGGVLWMPVLIKGNQIRTPDRLPNPLPAEENIGWLASRQPPLHKDKMKALNMVNPLRLDVTDLLRTRIHAITTSSASSVESVLYDCRFLVHFDISRIPQRIVEQINESDMSYKIMLIPNTRWYWPQIVEENGNNGTVLHSEVQGNREILSFLKAPDAQIDYTSYWKRREVPVVADWIKIEWIRPLTAL